MIALVLLMLAAPRLEFDWMASAAEMQFYESRFFLQAGRLSIELPKVDCQRRHDVLRIGVPAGQQLWTCRVEVPSAARGKVVKVCLLWDRKPYCSAKGVSVP